MPLGAASGIRSDAGMARMPMGVMSTVGLTDSTGGHGSLPHPHGAGHEGGQSHGMPSAGRCWGLSGFEVPVASSAGLQQQQLPTSLSSDRRSCAQRLPRHGNAALDTTRKKVAINAGIKLDAQVVLNTVRLQGNPTTCIISSLKRQDNRERPIDMASCVAEPTRRAYRTKHWAGGVLATSGRRHDSRSREVGAMTEALKGIVQSIGVCVLTLSQLNRVSAATGKAPNMSELRDSGEIEQHADVVLMLHRTSPPDGRTVDELDPHIAKNRNGATATLEGVRFNKPLTMFERAPVGATDRPGGEGS